MELFNLVLELKLSAEETADLAAHVRVLQRVPRTFLSPLPPGARVSPETSPRTSITG
jgi:hypothetical protein